MGAETARTAAMVVCRAARRGPMVGTPLRVEPPFAKRRRAPQRRVERPHAATPGRAAARRNAGSSGRMPQRRIATFREDRS
jgi:hypothetical protein